MALIKETTEWVENIYLIEPNDPVEGGEDGVDNRPHIELANRTAFLNKKRQEQEQKTQEIDDKVNGLTTQVTEIQVTIQNGGNNQSSGDLDTKLTQEIQARTDGDSHLQGQIDGLKEQIKQILANGGANTGGARTPATAFDINLSTQYFDNDRPKAWGMKVSAQTTFGGFVPVVDGTRSFGAYDNATVTIPDWVTDSSQVVITITNKIVNNAENYITLDIPNHRINIRKAPKGFPPNETVHPAGRVNVTFYR
nr:hypothetical protein [uncultured Moraxella sp.]